MIIHVLVPGAEYGGVPGATKAEYAALRWNDEHPKPTWTAVTAVWPAVEQAMLDEQSKPDVLTLLGDRMTVMESELSALKVSRA